MSLQTRKRIFIGIMLLSYVPIFLYLNYSSATSLNTLALLIGSLCGMIGVMLMTWQYLMGIRGLVSKFVPDLIWVNNWHKKIGMYGFLIILIHPTFMFLYYLSVGINLAFPITLASTFDRYKALGEIGFTILAITWISSAFLRTKISFRWWKRIHIFNLVILPLVLIHSLTIGLTLLTTNLKYYWYFIAVVVAVVLLYRFILFKFLGLNRLRYTVTAVHKLTDTSVQIDMIPSGKGMTPQPGQFIYFRPLSSWETHPFTVSMYNPQTRIISITPKASGPFSSKIQNIQVGEKVWLDGPYGVFTRSAYTTARPIVLVAGGIGVTPFVQIFQKLSQGWQKRVILLYGNQTTNDIAYGDLIKSTAQVNSQFSYVNILSRQEDYSGEKGYIDGDKIHKFVSGNLSDYDYYICGPQIMMDKVTAALKAEAVPVDQMHMERFSL